MFKTIINVLSIILVIFILSYGIKECGGDKYVPTQNSDSFGEYVGKELRKLKDGFLKGWSKNER